MNRFYYLLFCLFFCRFLQAQELDTTMWVANQQVNAILKVKNTIYLGGQFNHIGPNTGGGAVFDPKSSQIKNPFPRINGKIDISISDEKGGWFLAGEFNKVGGIARQKLIHILSDYTLDQEWKPVIDGNINCLALSNNRLYVGGTFNILYAPFRTGILAIDASTGSITDWKTALSGDVLSIAVSGGRVYAGGNFKIYHTQEYQNLISVEEGTGQITDWNPKPNSGIRQIVIHKDIVYVSGNFSEIAGENRQRIAAIHAITGLITPFNPSPDAQIETFTLYNDILYISGAFTTIASQARSNLAAININTGLATEWKPNLFPFGLYVPLAIVAKDNIVYVGGDMPVTDQTHGTLAALDAETGAIKSWDPSTNGPVHTLSFSGDNLFIGGSFSSVGGEPRLFTAALDAITGELLPWNPRVDSYVYALAAIGNTIFIGGSFQTVGGQSRQSFAAVDAATGIVKSYQANSMYPISQLLVFENKLFIRGMFNNIGGKVRYGIAVFDLMSGKITDWDAQLEKSNYIGVNCMTILNRRLYIGGHFTSAANELRRNLAAYNIETGKLTTWNPGTSEDGIVTSITAANGKIYVGGGFTKIGGEERQYLAALDPETGIASDWYVNPNEAVVNLASSGDSTLYVGGYFSSIGGQARKKLASIDLRTGLVTNWKADIGEYPHPPGTSFPIPAGIDNVYLRTIFIFGKSVYVGGAFRSINNYALHGGFAAFGERPELGTNIIKGNIFNDTNANCSKESTETSLLNLIVVAQPGNYYASTDSLGNYELLLPKGKYTLSQFLPTMKGFEVKQICPAIPNYAIEFTSTNQVIANKNFANQANIQPFLAVDISSDRRRRCFRNETTVYYRNEGFASASNVQIKVAYPEYVIPISSSIPWKSRQGDTLFFELNALLAQSSGSITIIDSVVCGNESIRGLTQCTQAIITPGNQLPQDTRWDQSSLALFATCKDNGFVRLVIKNTGKGDMADSTAYRIFLDASLVFSADCKLNSGDSLILEVPVNGKTIRMEADQRPYHPGESKPSITLEGCGSSAHVIISKGFVDQLPQDDAAEEVAISCMEILDSYDPNDKQASPSGPSDTHMIRKGEELEYTIRFQNTGTDVAYTVVIEDELHENLDVATLRMGASSHPNTWKISGEGKPKITWTFNHINLPDSTSNERESHGFVSFRIRQKADNTIGASIANQAYITFDFNSPIVTNVVYHTIGELPVADAKIAVTICDGSKPDSAVAGNTIVLTEQSTTQLNANQPVKGYGRWKLVSGTATIINPEDPHTRITDLGAGKNILEWTIYFCSQTSASQVTIERVVIPAVPLVNNPAPYCANDVIQPLTAHGQHIEWYADATLQTLLASGESYQPAVSQTDTLYVTQTISGYRSIARQVVITIQPPVSAPVVPSTVYYCKTDQSVNITADGENIEWFADATLQTKVGTGTDFTISTIEDKTLYATQQVNGCRSTPASVALKAGVFEPKQVFIANVITPNGDNKNEAFTAPQLDSNSCIGQFQYVQIFNRYGKKVFESSNEHFAWNGAGTSTGVYYYILSYSEFTYSGAMSVLY